jgi:hypothetical protein
MSSALKQLSLIADDERQTASDDNYCTPRSIADLVERMGPVKLDPFWNLGCILPSEEHWSISHGDRTFLDSWQRGGLVFINGPYSRNPDVAAKVKHEASCGVEEIGLFQLYAGQDWFQRNLYAAQRWCLPGRITFHGAKDPALFHVVLPYFGPRTDLFTRTFGALGPVIEPRDLRGVRP